MQAKIERNLKKIGFPDDIFELLMETVEDYNEDFEKPILYIFLMDIDINIIVDGRYHIIDKLKRYMSFLLSINIEFVLHIENCYVNKYNIGHIYLESGLRNIIIDEMMICDDSLQNMVFSSDIVSLSLYNTSVTTEGWARFDIPPGLQILDIANNNICYEGLMNIRLPSNLVELHLSFNKLCAKSMRDLWLPKTLEILDISYNNLGDDGIYGLLFPLKLKILNISGNNIETNGIKGFCPPPRLEKLSICNNNLDDKSLKYLVLPPRLTMLDLYGNNIVNIAACNLGLTPFKSTLLLEKSKYSPAQLRKRYNYVKWLYQKNIRKEICRGLIFGTSDVPIYRFMKEIYGSTNIRRNILQYYLIH